MRMFCRVNEGGVTLLIASHDLALIDPLGNRRIKLEAGPIDAPAEAAESWEEPEIWE